MNNALGNLVDYWQAIESSDNIIGASIWEWQAPFALKQAGKVEATAEATGRIAAAISSREFPYTLPRDTWKIVRADSFEPSEGEPAHAIDGKPNTYWHTRWQGNAPRPPHELVIDLGVKAELTGVTVRPGRTRKTAGLATTRFTPVWTARRGEIRRPKAGSVAVRDWSG